MKKMRLPKPVATRVVHNRLTLGSVYTAKQMRKFAEKAVLLERERIIAANAPEIEKINAHIKALEKAVEDEREAIAQMIEDAPKLVKFATNDKGGCLVCGFTPKLAAAAIRARGKE